MAEIIIQRIDKLNSMYVDFNVSINGKYVDTIANNSTISLADVPIGTHEICVSNLKGIYRSRKIKVTIKENDEIKYFETGPNTSIEQIFPLGVFVMGLITIRSYYIKEIYTLNSVNKPEEKMKDEYFCLNKPFNIFLLLIPVIYIFINKIGFPEYYQLIGNLIMLAGNGLYLFKRINKRNSSNLIQIKASYFLAYTILMTVISSENYFLLLFNLFVLTYLVIKYIKIYLTYPE